MIIIMSANLTTLLRNVPGREKTFVAGAAVFRLDDPVKWVHLVNEGRIHLVRLDTEGASLILQRAMPGSLLAEASVYAPRYHCDAVAETDAVTWAISRAELRSRLTLDTEFAEAWARHLAHEVQRARLHTQILSRRSVAQRLDAWRTWHGALPPKGEWALLAEQIAVSPEALYRELAKRRDR